MRKKLKRNLKSNKGITMIALSIAIITLAILTGMLTYYSTDSIEIKKLNNMYNDIEQLQEKVSIYYYENERIPILTEYPGVETIIGSQKSNLDGDKYYVLELSKLKNIELNLGKDFETVKNGYKTEGFNLYDYADIYVINESSHNIYYIKGIKVEEKIYYAKPQTDTQEQIDLKTTQISSIEDLIRFKQNVASGKTYENEYVLLTRNLDFDNPNSYDGTEVTIDSVAYTYGGTNDLQAYFSESGEGWTPIGNETNDFLGTFEGNNYKIINIYSSTEENKKLFETTTEIIKNIEAEWK